MSMKCSQPIGIEGRWRQPMGSGAWSGRRSPTFAPDLNGRNSVEGQLGASLRLFWLPLTFLKNEVQPNTFRSERVEHCTQEALEKNKVLFYPFSEPTAKASAEGATEISNRCLYSPTPQLSGIPHFQALESPIA